MEGYSGYIMQGYLLLFFCVVSASEMTTPDNGQSGLIKTISPVGISSYFGLSSQFPLSTFCKGVASRFEMPLVAVLLDGHRLYKPENITMYLDDGKYGDRKLNPHHFNAIRTFLEALRKGTPNAISRHVQLYLVNGPAQRDEMTYSFGNVSARDFNTLLMQPNSTIVRDLLRYVERLVSVLEAYESDYTFQITGMLEDNMNSTHAQKLSATIASAGWKWAQGRSVCGCHPGADLMRLPGLAWERHPNSLSQANAYEAMELPGDTWTNDGWMGNISLSNVSFLAEVSQQKQLNHHFWYNCIQGYCDGGEKPDDHMYFQLPPSTLVDAMLEGVARVVPQQ